MNHREIQKKLIKTAAALACGDDLAQLYRVCEYQKRIDTDRLRDMLDSMHERMKAHAEVIRQGYEALSDLGVKS